MDSTRKPSEYVGKIETTINKPKVASQHTLGKLSVIAPIPQDVLDLLWFSDGPLKNYVPVENSNSFEVGPIVVTIGFGHSEPSAISVNLPVIQRPVDWKSIPDPSYYPSYDKLTPEQRRKYLEWLIDVEQDIQIGYVFVFYYGLERHLFFGRVDEAFEMVLRLRRSHPNQSFTYYSDSALVASALFHNRPDLFLKYLDATSALGMSEASGIYLLAKAALGFSLIPEDIMFISRKVGFTNRRYITAEPELFRTALGDLLEQNYGQRAIPLNLFPVTEWPKKSQLIIANISFPPEQRTIPIPQLLEYVKFQQTVTGLLQETHDAVKAQLKARSKNSVTQLAKPLEKITQPIEYPRVREGHSLFPPFNEEQFNRNVECYNKGICPYCDNPLSRRPEQAMKCPSCGNRIHTRNNFFTRQIGLFRDDEVSVFKTVAKERARRNFVCDIMDGQVISARDVRANQATHNCTIEEALIVAVASKAAENQRNSKMGLCRNSVLASGQIYMHIGDKSRALIRMLQVAFYDVNGCTNAGGIPGSAKFDLRFGESVAPGILGWINDLADKQAIPKHQLRETFISAANKIYEQDMPHRPEEAWEIVSQQLWPEE